MNVNSVRNLGTAGYTANFCANRKFKNENGNNILVRNSNEATEQPQNHTGRNITIGTAAAIGLAAAADFIFAKGKHVKQLLKFGKKGCTNIAKNTETLKCKNRISSCAEDIIDKAKNIKIKFVQQLEGEHDSKITRTVFDNGSRIDYVIPHKTSMANNYSVLYNEKNELIEKTIFAVDGRTPVKKFVYNIDGKVTKTFEKMPDGSIKES